MLTYAGEIVVENGKKQIETRIVYSLKDNKYFKHVAVDGQEDALQIYEYIEDEQAITKESTIKTYKGSEILAMIEDGRLHREDILILANTNTEFEVAKIIDGYYGCEVLLKNKFVVKKKPVDFMTAYNSHKKVKPAKGEYIFLDMKDYLGVIYKSSQETADFLINGQWEIEY